MGRSPCCDKAGLKRGPWTPEEDHKLISYIQGNGHGNWRSLPAKAGLQRCGKSCRLRWANYLRPDIKRGKFNFQEEQTIIQLHALLGNRWSAIATHLPKRTDNEIKNYWNTHLKKRLTHLGIDPATHKPKSEALFFSSTISNSQSKKAAILSHMAQWESARLEAEARLAKHSKLHSVDQIQNPISESPVSSQTNPIFCPDILTSLNGSLMKPNLYQTIFNEGELESPTSSVSYSENTSTLASTLLPEYTDGGINNDNDNETIGFINNMCVHQLGSLLAQEQESEGNSIEKYTDILVNGSADDKSFSGDRGGGEMAENGGGSSGNGSMGKECCGDNNIDWNNILDLVNVSTSDSSVF